MNELTIAIPVHNLEKDDKELLDKAINSLNEQTDLNFSVILYIKKGLNYRIPQKLVIDVERINVDEDFSYQQAINKIAKEHVRTEWFSMLEMDDVFQRGYVANFYEHLNYYEDEYDLYLNIVAELNAEQDFLGLRNDTAWLVQNMQQLGILDLESCKKKFQNISLVGAIYKTDAFLSAGGMKENFPIFFNYEYLLRALNKSHEIYVIPKVMVKHLNLRKGSYFDQCDSKYNDDHKRGFYNLVTTEYMFSEDKDLEDMVLNQAENKLKVVK